MVTPFDIYLLGTIDGFKEFLLVAGIVSFMSLLFPLFRYMYETDLYDEVKKRTKTIFAVLLATSLVLFAAATLLPSSKTLAAMYVIPVLATPAVEKLPQVAAKLADEWMKEKTKEIANVAN